MGTYRVTTQNTPLCKKGVFCVCLLNYCYTIFMKFESAISRPTLPPEEDPEIAELKKSTRCS
jgi:hypothetical protein